MTAKQKSTKTKKASAKSPVKKTAEESKKVPAQKAPKKMTAIKTSPKAQISSTQEEDENAVLVTEAGLKSLKEELLHLKEEKRKEVAERLKEAISYGDLSENSEYEEAKNEQAFVEGRILELEKQVKHARIIKGKKAAIVRIGSTVKLQLLPKGVAEEYTIVGSTEADPLKARISNESPLGKAILGKKKSDEVTVDAPGGKFKYKIIGLK